MPRSLRELLRHPAVREVAGIEAAFGFMALHGGIEPSTYEIAEAAALASGAGLYAVVQPEWREPDGHLTSVRYDRTESRLLDAFLSLSTMVLSLHGMNLARLNDKVALGGGNRSLAGRVGRKLRSAGFRVIDDMERIPRHLRGEHPLNPVNLPSEGGVQIEIGRNLRLDPSAVAGLTDVLTDVARSEMAGRGSRR